VGMISIVINPGVRYSLGRRKTRNLLSVPMQAYGIGGENGGGLESYSLCSCV
jgi:hypothetical protein